MHVMVQTKKKKNHPVLVTFRSHDQSVKKSEISSTVSFLVRELKEHYLTARADMMLAARTRPIHGEAPDPRDGCLAEESVTANKRVLTHALGVLSALQRCLLESPGSVCDSFDPCGTTGLLKLLEDVSLLLLGVLYGDMDACLTQMGTEATYRYRSSTSEPICRYLSMTQISCAVDAPPSFCDMGNAIKTLIAQSSAGGQRDEEECVLLSEEHSLVLTCCWVSLKVKQNLSVKEVIMFLNGVMFLVPSGNRNLSRFSGRKDAQRIQTKQVLSDQG